MPIPQTANTPITAIGKASPRVKPRGFSTSHKGGHRKKSNMLTSKNMANSRPDKRRITDGNVPKFSRLASQTAAVLALITNQLWNSESITRWYGED